jgi:hypothetical protein
MENAVAKLALIIVIIFFYQKLEQKKRSRKQGMVMGLLHENGINIYATKTDGNRNFDQNMQYCTIT